MAQALVAERQHLLEKVFLALPWFSLASFLSGLTLASRALFQWRKRQSLRDKAEELEVQKLERELTAMTPQQVDEKLKADIEEQLRTALPDEVASATTQFRIVEQRVRDRISGCLSELYIVRANQRLANAEYDVVLESRTKDSPDVIVEIKYIRKGFHSGWLRESVSRLVLANDYYAEKLKRNVISSLLVVTAESAQVSIDGFDNVKRHVLQLSMFSRTALRVERVTETEITSLSCAALKKMILG